jgi:hypothetical protein
MSFDHHHQSPGERFRDFSLPDRIRCHYTNAHGVRCEYRIADPSTGLCVIHQRQVIRKMEDRARSLADRLFQDAGTLKSREEIRGFIVELLHLVAEQRIDRGDAGILSYGCSLLLQTLPSRSFSEREEENNRFLRWMLAGCAPEEAQLILASNPAAAPHPSSAPAAPITVAAQSFASNSEAPIEPLNAQPTAGSANDDPNPQTIAAEGSEG